MTRSEIVRTLAAIEHRLATEVRLVRVVVDASGVPTGRRIYRASFAMPLDWQPPTFAVLMAAARREEA